VNNNREYSRAAEGHSLVHIFWKEAMNIRQINAFAWEQIYNNTGILPQQRAG
jgi:hypothetical protein